MADVKISELPALTSPDGAEELVVNDGGTTKKITITNATSAALPKAGGTMTGALVVNDTVTADGLVVDGDGLLYSASNVEMRGSANVRISLGTAGTSGANNSSNWVYGNGTNLRFNNAGGFYSWETLGTERMRLSSGNLIVGATAVGGVSSGTKTYITSTGNLYVASSGEEAAYFNRNSNDGSIVEFRKNNATVGSIGTASSKIYIGSGDAGLYFNKDGNAITPVNTTTVADNDAALDLGTTTARFKDAYLSGGVYLGGTGSANKLDDYEEGTWTSLVSTSGGNMTSLVHTNNYYTKIGRLVTLSFDVGGNISSTGSEANFRFHLPFSAINSTSQGAGGTANFLIGSGASRFGLGQVFNGTSASATAHVYIPSREISANGTLGGMRVQMTYLTN